MPDRARTPRRGLMLVISSPSGAGKTSLSRRLIAEHQGQIELSVSCTTRAPRPGELDGREYHFVSTDEFEEMIRGQAFLEYATVHENRYGTPRDAVMAMLELGRDVLFDVDWQGAFTISAGAPGDVVRVFILPPTMADLRSRLLARAQDDPKVIERRLSRAEGEIEHWTEYDYVLVNDDFDCAYEELRRIYLAERSRRERNAWLAAFVRGLLAEGS
ncbi:MAG: guanylate kinase [Caulobacteraceae bacterium]